ncbi:MAG: hypothetical protein ACSLE6_05645 [Mycobacterium sp.]
MSSESPLTKSGPPLASSWAAPPEFYIDEGLAGKSLRRFFQDLGYTVHTPPSVFGTRHESQGTPDEVWLRTCGENSWAAISKDTKILERPDELAALTRPKIHIFYYPAQATRAELLAVAEATLSDVCTISSSAGGGAWRVRGGTRPHIERIAI